MLSLVTIYGHVKGIALELPHLFGMQYIARLLRRSSSSYFPPLCVPKGFRRARCRPVPAFQRTRAVSSVSSNRASDRGDAGWTN